MVNLTELRKAQRMVSHALYPQYLGLDDLHRPNEYSGSLDDIVWNEAQGKELPTLEHAEKQFIETPTVETALTYWECAIAR